MYLKMSKIIIQIWLIQFQNPWKLSVTIRKVFSGAATRQIKRALDLIMNAQYPLIIAGGGCVITESHEEIEELVNTFIFQLYIH